MAHTSVPPWRGVPAAAALAAAVGVATAGTVVGAAAGGAVGLAAGAVVGAAAAGGLVGVGAAGAGEHASSSHVVPISPPAAVAVRIRKVRRFRTLMLDRPFSCHEARDAARAALPPAADRRRHPCARTRHDSASD